MRLAIGSGVAFRDEVAGAGQTSGNAQSFYADLKSAEKRLRWWKSKGVEGIVFYDAMPGFYRVGPEAFAGIKSVLDEVGLPVAAFNTLRKSLFMPELADHDEARLYHCLAVCEVLKPSIVDVNVNVPIPHGLDPMQMAARPTFRGVHASSETVADAALRLKKFTKRLAAIGAELSVELHDDGIHDTADGCLRLVNLIDEPNVGVNPDVGNWYRVAYQHPDSWRDQMAKMAPRTNYWEVKNYRRILVPDDHRAYSWNVDLDEGEIDFRACAVTLWNAGFRGWVCSEGGNGDVIHSNLKYLQYMRWILDEWIPSI